MGRFYLMRAVTATIDPVSRAVAEAIVARDHARGDTQRVVVNKAMNWNMRIMEFWNMKQRGEIPAEDPFATWAVLMRWIDVPQAVRLLLMNTIDGYGGWGNAGWMLSNKLKSYIGASVKGYSLRKMQGNLMPMLWQVALDSTLGVECLAPTDFSFFIQACESALVAEKEDQKRWRTAKTS